VEGSASVVAVAVVFAFALALLFVIPQRSGGICCLHDQAIMPRLAILLPPQINH
jgi:hypothetical protein